ncbi:MAG: 3-phosphoshikimate 1-carboxyvinyltransferase [Phycisphaerales bacterium]
MSGRLFEGALEALPDPLPVPVLKVSRRFGLTLRTPGSKSETNRAIILAGLASGRSVLRGALVGADDAERALDAVRALGASASLGGTTITIEGVGGRWRVGHAGATVDLQNAGTATRFLAASALLADGPVTVTGNERMRQRPIGQLAGALHELGGTVEFHERDGCPPLTVTPPAGGPARGRELVVRRPDSSQFVSALLMLGPWIPGGVTIRIEGEVTSAPYLAMTLDLLDRVGAEVSSTADLAVLRCAPAASVPGLAGFELDIEPDASGATTFWSAAALLPGCAVTVPGLGFGSVQGDARFVRVLERMGAEVEILSDGGEPSLTVRGPTRLEPVLADLSAMPDTAMNLAVVCCFAHGTSVLRGLRTLRVKETDRIAALERELSKLGVRVDVQGDDAITITPPKGGLAAAEPVEFDTYDDHRMAMSLSLVGLRRPGVAVRDPGCVAKTYPGYWADLGRLYEAAGQAD